jgi:hypothetical protein
MLQQVIQLLLNQSDCLLNDLSVCEYIKRYIEWYIVILYWFIYSHLRWSWVRVVFDFNASASNSAPFESIWLSVEWCVSVWIYKEIYWVIYFVILYWFIYSPSRLSWMRVVFDFNASASDSIPFEPIWFPVQWCVNKSECEYIKRYIEWYIVILYWFIYSPSRLSWMRVVFDFNALASDSAPFEPIRFPVEWCVSVCEYIKRYIEWYIVILYWFIYSHLRSSWVRELCLISMLQQSIQLLLNQSYSLLNNVCVNVCEYIKRYIEWYIFIWYWFIYLPPSLSWVRVGSLRLRRLQISTSLRWK